MKNKSLNKPLPTHLPVVGLYGTNKISSGDDISGTQSSLFQLAEALTSCTGRCSYRLSKPRTTSPEPYEGFLSSLVVILAEGLLRIQREDECLTIAGSEGNISDLASYIASFAEQAQGPGAHIHFEHWPDHDLLDASSGAVIVRLWEWEDLIPA